jgi:hypothetical protein
MSMKKSQWLSNGKLFTGQKAGQALVKWLNDPHVSPKFVEDLLRVAQVVFRRIAKYGSLRELNIARRQKKLAPAFWDCHRKLNKTLATFTYAPQIYLHEFPDGDRVSWMLATEEPPIALVSVQVRCVLRLIEQESILKILRCKHCTKWFFARFSHQKFCTTKCRVKHLVGSEKFKEKRRKYMQKYHWIQKKKNVK